MNASHPFTFARRMGRMSPSAIRELLKLTERPEIISLAGGLPSPDGFPVEALREASARVLRDTPCEALQYAASEGYAPLREWVAAEAAAAGLAVDASQVLITSGSQQGLDLVAKVLTDAGSRIAVESPGYLGALQAFAAYEPEFAPLVGDDDGPRPEALRSAGGARFFYAQPNFQNPTGRCIGEARRAALVEAARSAGVPVVEDDPYGELWYDAPPPASLASRWPEGSVFLGSFSKVLAPGLRLGYLIAPRPLFQPLLQAKQASDLHTPGFNQRLVHAVLRDGLLPRHLPALRARYRSQRDAMLAALRRHLPAGCRYAVPGGGMFFWIALPAGMSSAALLPLAVARGVAFVPGAAFYAAAPRADTLRLSFATVTPAQIEQGVARLADAMAALAAQPHLHDAAVA